MTSLFVSYSRRDSAFAHRLIDAFKGKDWEFWIDWEDIPPTVDWRKEIEKGIEESDVFLCLIGPNSSGSKYCRREIEHAAKNGKRLIPIVIEDVSPEDVPPELSALNWIFFRASDDFNASLEKLITAVKTDYEWVAAHRDLQVNALEWDRNRRDKSYLLRGTELQLAELQLMSNAAKEPHPTQLQREYVIASRKATERQRRTTAFAVLAAVLALAVLALWGWGQAVLATANEQKALKQEAIARTQEAIALNQEAIAKSNLAAAQTAQAEARHNQALADANAATALANQQEAERQAQIALSRQLAAQAQNLRAEQFDLALLLANEASRGTAAGRLSLWSLLRAEPHLVAIISAQDYMGQGESGFITGLALSPDGDQLAAQSYGGEALWTLNTHQAQRLEPGLYGQYLEAWSPYGVPPQDPSDLLHGLVLNSPLQTSSAVPSRAAYASCRTQPSAGGAPGCASLIYIASGQLDRLVTPLPSCGVEEAPRGFDIGLDGGLYQVRGLQQAGGQPVNFDLYSVALADKASNNGSSLADARYEPQANWLVTAAAVSRHGSELALHVWDVAERKPVLELFTDLWDARNARLSFANDNQALDICVDGAGMRIDIAPESWRAQACEIAGRNLSRMEWQQFFGAEPYRLTCPDLPAGE